MSSPAEAPGAGRGGAPADGAALRARLRAEGHDVEVESDGTLALLVPRGGDVAALAAARAAVVAAARACGFTHVAVELPDSPRAESALGKAPTAPGRGSDA